MLWCALWFLTTADTPAKHKRISLAEKRYIERSLHGQVVQGENRRNVRTMPLVFSLSLYSFAQHRIPWCDILKSMPNYAIMIGHATGCFGAYLVLTTLPSYMKNVLHFDIKSVTLSDYFTSNKTRSIQNGLLSAIPYIAYFLGIQIGGLSADFLRSRRILNTTHVRKLAMIVALVGQAIFFVLTGHLGNCHNPLLAVLLITVAQVCASLLYTLTGRKTPRASVASPTPASSSTTLTLHLSSPARFLASRTRWQLSAALWHRTWQWHWRLM